jgi:dephospho-CoA kinase
MLSVALTGGIGTGKSVALARFAELGTPVVEADTLAHDAIAPGTPGAAAVRERFSEGVIGPDGCVDRVRLGALVFDDSQARRDLEAIVHPAVYRAIREWMRAREASGARMAIAEIPLLFETGHEGDFACVVVTACAEAEQVRRAMARTSLSETEVRRRIEAQGPLDDKVRRADYVIWTDGTIEDTRVRAAAVWDALNRRAVMGSDSTT